MYPGMKAVVLAAGRGTRMRPLTDSVPKPLLPVANRPLVERILEQCAEAGVDEAVLVVNYREDRIREAVGDGMFGVDVTYVRQEEARGTGDAVLAARGLDDDLLVINGDLYLEGDLLERMAGLSGAGMAVKEVPDPEHYGSVVVNDGRVERLVEKSSDPPSNLINAGVYRFTPEVFDVLEGVGESERGEVELTDAVSALDRVGAERVDGYWLDVGYPWDLLEANERALRDLDPDVEGEVEEGAVLKGPVSVGEGAVVRSGAYVKGPVAIGEGCEVGPNCYVRPGTSLGDDVRVGNGVEVKNSVLMDGTNVGHLSYVGDSVLGPCANVGAGTMFANLRHDGSTVPVEVKGETIDSGRRKLGAVLGARAKTGVNTSLDPGTVLGEGLFTVAGDCVSGTNLEEERSR